MREVVVVGSGLMREVVVATLHPSYKVTFHYFMAEGMTL
jgi:hypothetical protein